LVSYGYAPYRYPLMSFPQQRKVRSPTPAPSDSQSEDDEDDEASEVRHHLSDYLTMSQEHSTPPPARDNASSDEANEDEDDEKVDKLNVNDEKDEEHDAKLHADEDDDELKSNPTEVGLTSPDCTPCD
jgi:hypothetical protein